MGGKVSSGTVRGTVPDQLGSAVQQLRESGVDVTYCSCGASGLQQFFQGLVQLVELTSHNGRKLTPHVPSNRGERFVWKACGRADHDAHVSSVQHRVKTNFIREGQLRMARPLESTHTLQYYHGHAKAGLKDATSSSPIVGNKVHGCAKARIASSFLSQNPTCQDRGRPTKLNPGSDKLPHLAWELGIGTVSPTVVRRPILLPLPAAYGGSVIASSCLVSCAVRYYSMLPVQVDW